MSIICFFALRSCAIQLFRYSFSFPISKMATGQLQLQPQCFAGGVKHNELCAEPLLEEVCKDLTALLLKVAQEQVTSSDKAMSEKRADFLWRLPAVAKFRPHLVTCTCRQQCRDNTWPFLCVFVVYFYDFFWYIYNKYRYFYLFPCLPISTHLFIYLSIYLFIYLSIYLFTCLSIYFSFQSIQIILPICLYYVHLSSFAYLS